MADGIRGLRKALDSAAGEIEDALADAVFEEARDVWRDERKSVPVLTGELRDGIDWRLDSDLHATVGVFDPELFWAVWIEWGRKNAPAQPFATPAAEKSRRRFVKRAETAVIRATEKVS